MTVREAAVERWGQFELSLAAPQEGNPYAEQELKGYFSKDGHEISGKR